MLVIIDSVSAARLWAEGAYRVAGADGSVTRYGREATLPDPAGSTCPPVLVSGGCEVHRRRRGVDLARAGYAAWVVVDDAAADPG